MGNILCVNLAYLPLYLYLLQSDILHLFLLWSLLLSEENESFRNNTLFSLVIIVFCCYIWWNSSHYRKYIEEPANHDLHAFIEFSSKDKCYRFHDCNFLKLQIPTKLRIKNGFKALFFLVQVYFLISKHQWSMTI